FCPGQVAGQRSPDQGKNEERPIRGSPLRVDRRRWFCGFLSLSFRLSLFSHGSIISIATLLVKPGDAPQWIPARAGKANCCKCESTPCEDDWPHENVNSREAFACASPLPVRTRVRRRARAVHP